MMRYLLLLCMVFVLSGCPGANPPERQYVGVFDDRPAVVEAFALDPRGSVDALEFALIAIARANRVYSATDMAAVVEGAL